MKTIHIDDSMCEQRLDRLVSKLFKTRSSNSAQKWIRTKLIKVNGKKAAFDYRLQVGDEVQIYLPDELFQLEESRAEKKKRRIQRSGRKNLDIVYEDEEILVVNKPKGLLVHPAEGEYKDSLSSYVQSYLYDEIRSTFSPASVSRLDFNTEGLVLFCKTYNSLKEYNRLMRERKLKKYYLAICHGRLAEERKIEGYLQKNEDGNIVKLSREKGEDAKFSSCLVKPIKSTERFSLVEIDLDTGRTHQIRASLASIGHPILGDKKYGARPVKGVSSQVLVAHKLVLPERSVEIKPDSVYELWKRLV